MDFEEIIWFKEQTIIFWTLVVIGFFLRILEHFPGFFHYQIGA